MNQNKENQLSSKEYALFFLEKFKSADDIIPEVFRLFSVNCIDFCKINPHELDSLINDFFENKSDRVQILSRIIDLRRYAGNSGDYDNVTLYERILAYVEENFLEDFRVSDMAEELSISYYYMCHLFKEMKGCSIKSYKNTLKLQRAEKLLCTSDKSITDIAFESGFENPGYFTEKFTAYCGLSPTEFRNRMKGNKIYFDYYTDKDICLANRMNSMNFLDNAEEIHAGNEFETCRVYEPDEKYRFTHGTAVVEFGGVLYASWYNCPERDLVSHTLVRGKRSYDGGRSWTDIETIDEDVTGRIMFAPPSYGVCEDRLYMFINEMVAPDYIHSFNTYILDGKTDKFRKINSVKNGFKLNTNAMKLPDERYMIAGRAGATDRLPLVPAVMLSATPNPEDGWRIVKIAPDKFLPDGESFVYPETCPVINGGRIYMFCRNDRRNVPVVYISEDNGETWSEPYAHDIPFDGSKIYCGTLSDGRNYIVANTGNKNRTKLVLYVSEISEMRFKKCYVISEGDGSYETSKHYPCAYESNGRLYIIYSSNISWFTRGADIIAVDIDRI